MKPALFALLAFAAVVVGLALLVLWDGLRGRADNPPPYVRRLDDYRTGRRAP